MNTLRGKTVYLAGAIDKDPLGGKLWRDYLQKELEDRYEFYVFNPLKKLPFLKFGEEDGEDRDSRTAWKKNGEYDKLTKKMLKIAYADLWMVSASDFLILYLDMDIFTCLSFFEVAAAYEKGIPIFLVCRQGISEVPDGLFPWVDYRDMFDSFEEMFEVLDKTKEILEDKNNE